MYVKFHIGMGDVTHAWHHIRSWARELDHGYERDSMGMQLVS